MKTNRIIPMLLSLLLVGCGNNSNPPKGEAVTLPEAFKNRNFANAAITYYSGGVALIFDNDLKPDIQNISFHVEIYSIQFEAKEIKRKNDMYFLPFKVTDQIIDDGYLKNGVEYKFWLSYANSTYFCGISLNDDTLTEPTATLMEGTL